MSVLYMFVTVAVGVSAFCSPRLVVWLWALGSGRRFCFPCMCYVIFCSNRAYRKLQCWGFQLRKLEFSLGFFGTEIQVLKSGRSFSGSFSVFGVESTLQPDCTFLFGVFYGNLVSGFFKESFRLCRVRRFAARRCARVWEGLCWEVLHISALLKRVLCAARCRFLRRVPSHSHVVCGLN